MLRTWPAKQDAPIGLRCCVVSTQCLTPLNLHYTIRSGANRSIIFGLTTTTSIPSNVFLIQKSDLVFVADAPSSSSSSPSSLSMGKRSSMTVFSHPVVGSAPPEVSDKIVSFSCSRDMLVFNKGRLGHENLRSTRVEVSLIILFAAERSVVSLSLESE